MRDDGFIKWFCMFSLYLYLFTNFISSFRSRASGDVMMIWTLVMKPEQNSDHEHMAHKRTPTTKTTNLPDLLCVAMYSFIVKFVRNVVTISWKYLTFIHDHWKCWPVTLPILSKNQQQKQKYLRMADCMYTYIYDTIRNMTLARFIWTNSSFL